MKASPIPPDSYTPADLAGRHPASEAPRFGRGLAALRKERGLSQARLVELLDTSWTRIDYCERRATNASLEFITRAAEVLRVPAAQLVDDGADKPSRRGSTPRLQERFERIRRQPRGKQEFLIRFLDTSMDGAERRAS